MPVRHFQVFLLGDVFNSQVVGQMVEQMCERHSPSRISAHVYFG